MRIAKWENGKWCDNSLVAEHIAKFRYSKKYMVFENVGYDEDGHRIGNCKNCATNGVLVHEHNCL